MSKEGKGGRKVGRIERGVEDGKESVSVNGGGRGRVRK